jgi:hypothetical protein
LSGKLSPEAIKAWDTVLGEPKGPHNNFMEGLHKSPSEGEASFFTRPDVREALGLQEGASTRDAQDNLAIQLGASRGSHVSPEQVKEWVRAKGLGEDAMRAAEYGEQHANAKQAVRAPTEYEQTGIRKNRYNPESASLSEAVRAMGGLRITQDNRGEMRRLNETTTGLTRRNSGAGADEMITYLKEDGYFGKDEDVSIADFLSMLEADASGTQKHYSSQREFDYEEMYQKGASRRLR